jgi:hypothetical protein
MTRREKMLLGVMGGAVLVAAGFFALTGPGGKRLASGPDKAVVAAQKSAEEQVLAVRNAGANPFETHVADMALRPWNTNIFYDKPLDVAREAGRDASMPAFTGFVELGALRLAIIDGYEYREGDELETGGFQVEEIQPTQVTLRGTDTGKLLRLPYQDPSFFTQ